MNWRAGESSGLLQARAALLASIRLFFQSRGVLEVETPLLASSGITDHAIEPLIVAAGVSLPHPRYLQTSPEYAMKRILATGCGPIYQITKAFRDGETGSRHNPEFSLLEWYRPDYDYHQLMSEVAELACHCLGDRVCHKRTYRELFLNALDIDPFQASETELEVVARRELDLGAFSGSKDLWLDLLMSHLIEPDLKELGLCFVYDYPASQAALSRVVTREGVAVAQRFELYVDGMELANGYFELTDAAQLRSRFRSDNVRRLESGMAPRPIDELFLSAMERDMPDLSGVALGIDRLLMLVTGATEIGEVLAFDWEQS
ncbi:MAG: EF-P lysine aminoacylase GenX [Halieaceae bacterium]|jgi:elongation factor P--(R)-beta-lysine ligase|nr:EF-P lysine aminoacylase GenX [Halieaceae bacterium]